MLFDLFFWQQYELLSISSGFYDVFSIMQYLSSNLAEKYVAFVPVSSPPILSAHQCQNTTGFTCFVPFDLLLLNPF